MRSDWSIQRDGQEGQRDGACQQAIQLCRGFDALERAFRFKEDGLEHELDLVLLATHWPRVSFVYVVLAKPSAAPKANSSADNVFLPVYLM